MEKISEAVERLYEDEAQEFCDAKPRFAELVADLLGADPDSKQVDLFAEMMVRTLLVNQGVSLPHRTRCATGDCQPFNHEGAWSYPGFPGMAEGSVVRRSII